MVKKMVKKAGMRIGLQMLILLSGVGVIGLLVPERFPILGSVSLQYFLEIAAVFPGILILVGLFSAWVDGARVTNLVGTGSGWKGTLISLLIGTLPTGPLYVAFPIAKALLEKGARVSNVIVLLSAWACIKIPQELVELKFLGLKFMLLRLLLTVMIVIPMGILIEYLMGRNSVPYSGSGRKSTAF